MDPRYLAWLQRMGISTEREYLALPPVEQARFRSQWEAGGGYTTSGPGNPNDPAPGAVPFAGPEYPTGYNGAPPALPPAGPGGFDWEAWINAVYGGFGPGGTPTLAARQFEELKRQFDLTQQQNRDQFSQNIALLVEQNRLNASTLQATVDQYAAVNAEATASRLQADRQFQASFGLSLQEFAARQQDTAFQQGIATAGVTGTYQGAPTMAAREFQERSRQFDEQQAALERRRLQDLEQLRVTNQLNERTQAAVEAQYAALNAQVDAQREQDRVQFERTQAEIERAGAFQRPITEAGVTGYYQGNPTMAREAQQFNQGERWAQIAGNPRNIGQSLAMLGYNPQQAGALVQGSPGYGQISAGLPYQFAPYGNAEMGGGLAGDLAGGTVGMSNNFASPFATMGVNAPGHVLRGRALNPRSTWDAWASNSPMIPLISGVASMQGTDTEAFWGDWRAFLPQGAPNPLTAYV